MWVVLASARIQMLWCACQGEWRPICRLMTGCFWTVSSAAWLPWPLSFLPVPNAFALNASYFGAPVLDGGDAVRGNMILVPPRESFFLQYRIGKTIVVGPR